MKWLWPVPPRPGTGLATKPPKPLTSTMRRTALSLLIGFWLGALAWFAWDSDLTQPYDDRALSWMQPWVDVPLNLSQAPVRLVSIKNLDANDWPWNRLDYALLAHVFASHAVRAAAWEIPLDQPDLFQFSYDEKFASRLPRIRVNVLALTPDSGPERLVDSQLIEALPVQGDISQLPRIDGIRPPLVLFSEFARHGIDWPTIVKPDGIVRVPLLVAWHGQVYPSWTLTSWAAYLGAALSQVEIQLGQFIRLLAEDGSLLGEVPIDHQGRMTLRWTHPDQFARNTLPAENVILSAEQIRRGESPVIDLDQLHSTLVIVGRYHPQTVSFVSVGDLSVPPAEIHRQALANLLSGSALKQPDRWIMGGVMVLLGVLMTWGASVTPWWGALTWFFAQATATLVTVFLLLDSGGWSLPAMTLIIILTIGALAGGFLHLTPPPRLTPRRREDPNQLLLKFK